MRWDNLLCGVLQTFQSMLFKGTLIHVLLIAKQISLSIGLRVCSLLSDIQCTQRKVKSSDN